MRYASRRCEATTSAISSSSPAPPPGAAAAARWRALRSRLRERLVGDVPDEILEESVLAVLGRARIGLDAEHLLADERRRAAARARPRLRPVRATMRRFVNVFPRTAQSWSSSLLARKAVEPGGDEGVQRLGHLQRADLAHRPVGGPLLNEVAAVEQHPDRLDRIERDALGPGQDLLAKRGWEPGNEPEQEVLHRGRRERLEVERREVAKAGAPRGAALEQLRPGQREDVDRVGARQVEQLLDEVEERSVGPLHVLEDEHGRIRVRQPLEEEPPRREELLAVTHLLVAERDELRQPGLDERGAPRRRGCAPRAWRAASPAPARLPRPRRSGSASAPCPRAPST